MGRRLARTVIVGTGHARRAYVAGCEVDDDVAALITNPAAWGDDAPAEAASAPEAGQPSDAISPPVASERPARKRAAKKA